MPKIIDKIRHQQKQHYINKLIQLVKEGKYKILWVNNFKKLETDPKSSTAKRLKELLQEDAPPLINLLIATALTSSSAAKAAQMMYHLINTSKYKTDYTFESAEYPGMGLPLAKMSVLTMAAFSHEPCGSEIFEILLQQYDKQALENELIYQYFFTDKNQLSLPENDLALIEEKTHSKAQEIIAILQQRLQEIDQNLTPYKPPRSSIRHVFEKETPKLHYKISGGLTNLDNFPRPIFDDNEMRQYAYHLAKYKRWLDSHNEDHRYSQNWTNPLNRPGNDEISMSDRQYAKLKIIFDSDANLSKLFNHFSKSNVLYHQYFESKIQPLLLSFAFQNKDKITEIDFTELYLLRENAHERCYKWLFAADFFIYSLAYVQHIEEWIKNSRAPYLNRNDDFTETEQETIIRIMQPLTELLCRFLDDFLIMHELLIAPATVGGHPRPQEAVTAVSQLVDKLLRYKLISLLDYNKGRKDIIALLAFSEVSERAKISDVYQKYFHSFPGVIDVLKNYYHLSDLIAIAKNEVQLFLNNSFSPDDSQEKKMNTRLKAVISKLEKMLKEQKQCIQQEIFLNEEPTIYLDQDVEIVINSLAYDINQVTDRMNTNPISTLQQNLDELLNLINTPLLHSADVLDENQYEMAQIIWVNILDIVKKGIGVLASRFNQLANDEARHNIVKTFCQILDSLENSSQDASFTDEVIVQQQELATQRSKLAAMDAYGQKLHVPEKGTSFNKIKVKVGALFEHLKPKKMVQNSNNMVPLDAQQLDSPVPFFNEL
ncbi:MAG: hypothetical protein HKM04_10435 [Legionellales bacterium]|nr:hypothetical protein [Legionellales bacterium]